MQDFTKREYQIIVSIVLFIGLLFYLFAFDSYYFYDDVTYMRYANQINQGNFQLTNDNFCTRFGLTIPLSIIFKLFNINQITSTLLSLIFWIGSIIVTNKVLKNNFLGSSIATIFCGLDYYHIFFNNKLYPDMAVAFFCVLGLYFLYQQFFQKNTNENINVIGICTCFMLAFISKTTIIYILPFYIYLFVYSLKNRIQIQFWIKSLVLISILFLVYFGTYFLITNDPFYVFTTIENTHYTSDLSYSNKGFWVMFNRLTFEPILMLINCGMIIPLIFNIFDTKKTFINFNAKHFWFIASLSILIMFWFGSLSFTFYQPMSLNPRMIILLAPPLAIYVGFSIKDFDLNSKNIFFHLILCFIIILLSAKFISYSKSIVYCIIFISFLILYFQKNIKIFIIGLLLSLSIQPIYGIIKPKIYGFNEEKLIFEKYLLPNKSQNLIIVTDNRLVKSWDYYVQFNKPSKWQFLEFKYFNSSQISTNTKIYFLVNKGFCEYLNTNISLKNTHLIPITPLNKNVILYEYKK